MPRIQALAFVAVTTTTLACGDSGGPSPAVPGRVPLTEFNGDMYKGIPGGLYPDGANTEPAAHAAAGVARARAVTPRDGAGNADAAGKVVLLSVGMSNTSQEFCSGSATGANCAAWSFMGQAAADNAVNSSTLVIVNGARGGQTAQTWDAATDANYDTVANRLAALALTEGQVQAVWLKAANAGPTDSLPSMQSDAYRLETYLGDIVRALKTRYPNLQLVFLSSRIYAGYATTTLNPEPFAFESGFAVKWLIEAQIDQMANGGTVTDPRAGDLDYTTGGAPWLGWGPYLWGDGATPRVSDGLVWLPADFAPDGTHPSQSGQQKVGALLLGFFKSSPYAACWFVSGASCP